MRRPDRTGSWIIRLRRNGRDRTDDGRPLAGSRPSCAPSRPRPRGGDGPPDGVAAIPSAESRQLPRLARPFLTSSCRVTARPFGNVPFPTPFHKARAFIFLFVVAAAYAQRPATTGLGPARSRQESPGLPSPCSWLKCDSLPGRAMPSGTRDAKLLRVLPG